MRAYRHLAVVAVVFVVLGGPVLTRGTAAPSKREEASYPGLMKEGQLLLMSGKFAEAARAFEAALKEKPRDGAATAGLKAAREGAQKACREGVKSGLVLLGQRRMGEAVRAFEAALRASPKDEAALAGKKIAQEALEEHLFTLAAAAARAAAKAGQLEEALRQYDGALKLRPADKALAAERAAVAKKVEEARTEARKREEAYEAALRKGLLALAGKKYAESARAFGEALKAKPGDPAALGGKRYAEERMKPGGR